MGWFGSSVKVFADSGVRGEIQQLLTRAQKYVLIVSPYIDLGGNVLIDLVAKAQSRVDIQLVIRRDKEAEYRTTAWFSQLVAAGVKVASVERLHSKVYANEEEVIVGSANFSESSWADSRELCVGFPSDGKEGEEILRYVQRLLESSRNVAATRGFSKTHAPADGFCIGCRDGVPMNIDRPSCKRCYPDVRDEGAAGFCHSCGTKAKTSLEKPRCYSCFKSAA